jgi:hypothetical protein
MPNAQGPRPKAQGPRPNAQCPMAKANAQRPTPHEFFLSIEHWALSIEH